MNLYLLFYQVKKDIIVKYSNHVYGLKIGDYNGYDWRLIDIQVLYQGRFISMSEYQNIRDQFRKRRGKLSLILEILFDKNGR